MPETVTDLFQHVKGRVVSSTDPDQLFSSCRVRPRHDESQGAFVPRVSLTSSQ